MISTDLRWRETTTIALPRVADLAARLRRDIAIIDIESTTLLQRDNFAITEIGIIRVHQDGTVDEVSGLIDPMQPIDDVVSAKTGIHQIDVSGRDTFDVWIPLLRDLFAHAAICGFNADLFDVPGIDREMTRYGHNAPYPQMRIDVRTRYLELVRHTGNRSHGKLDEVAALFDIPIPVDGHRAARDARVTASLLEALLVHYGLAGVLGRPGHQMPQPRRLISDAAAPPRENDEAIARLIETTGYDPSAIARERYTTPAIVAERVLTLVLRGRLQASVVAIAEAQAWLRPRIDGLLQLFPIVETGLHLEQILAVAQLAGAPDTVDQLQIAVAYIICDQK
jgi:DNA polymerase III epsilon subunit-like protein